MSKSFLKKEMEGYDTYINTKLFYSIIIFLTEFYVISFLVILQF
jgi:hypothetical protein